MDQCGWADIFQCGTIPLSDWITNITSWIVDNYRPAFQAMKAPIDNLLRTFDWALTSVPPTIMLALIVALAWRLAGRKTAVGTFCLLTLLGFIGIWKETMTTMSIVLTALVVCLALGLPLGILAARSDRFFRVIRPFLDGMQTIPAFVYLVPIVMLFGIGNVPGVIVTVVFAVPPLIRLTNLGIRQVPSEVVEATMAFGGSKNQILWKVQIPLALPTIMAGVNQTLMMALSMAVIASMISVGGLGQMVLRGIGRLDMGFATVGGIGIVALAIVLDRLTQGVADAMASRTTQKSPSRRSKIAKAPEAAKT